MTTTKLKCQKCKRKNATTRVSGGPLSFPVFLCDSPVCGYGYAGKVGLTFDVAIRGFDAVTYEEIEATK